MTDHTLNREEGRIADQEFHAALLSASGNPFLASMTYGVTAAINVLTEFKLRIAPLQRNPLPDHWRVYEAVAAGNAEESRQARAELIQLALLEVPIAYKLKS